MALVEHSNLRDKDGTPPTDFLNYVSDTINTNYQIIKYVIGMMIGDDEVDVIEGGKKYTKKRRYKLNKMKKIKHSKKSGGQASTKTKVKYILLLFIIIMAFVPVNKVSTLITNFCEYTKSTWEIVIGPFLSKLLEEHMGEGTAIHSAVQTANRTVGVKVIGTVVSKIGIPTLKGIVDKTVGAFTGDFLALNGLYSAWGNLIKLIEYLKLIDYFKKPPVSPEIVASVKTAIVDVKSSLEGVAEIVSNPAGLPNASMNFLPNLKTIDIPSGSKLLISENENICPK